MKNYTGKTLDELLTTVAAEKGVSVEELTYYVTEEKSGFLGFGGSVSADIYAISDVLEFVESYLATLFKNLELEAEIEAKYENNGISVNLNAENNAVVIGKQGQSLRGLNQVLRSAVSSKFKRRFYVTIDINHYREERHQKVEALAKRLAKNVQRDHIDVALDPMPNDERKVIHQALTNYSNIETVSEGEGSNRHIVIKYVKN